MQQRYEIEVKLPSLNDYIKWCRSNKYYANKKKQEIEQQIAYYISKMPIYKNPIKINFIWVEDSKRRDLDNICFAKKFILDSMVKSGKLKDDNRKYVYAFTDNFRYENESKVILEIEEYKTKE